MGGIPIHYLRVGDYPPGARLEGTSTSRAFIRRSSADGRENRSSARLRMLLGKVLISWPSLRLRPEKAIAAMTPRHRQAILGGDRMRLQP